MKITALKDWNTLTPQEQARLRDMYQVGADDELPASITDTMASPSPTGQPDTNPTVSSPGDTTEITPKEGSTVVVNAEHVVVNENGEGDNG